MRALLAGERRADLGVVLGLAGVICLLFASLGLNLKQQKDLRDVKRVLIARCELRQAQDIATRDDLQARIDLYAAVLHADRRLVTAAPTARDVFTDRMDAYQQAMDYAQQRLASIGPPVNCKRAYAAPA